MVTFTSKVMKRNNTSLARLAREYRQILREPDPYFVAAPVSDDNLLIWHFTVKGPVDSPFQGGVYHGKIVFSLDYPFTPPDIVFLTPNGRFVLNKRICLNNTSFHPELWSPQWDVRTTVLSLIPYLVSDFDYGIGGIQTDDETKRKLAVESRSWKCSQCNLYIQPDELPGENKDKAASEIKVDNENDNNNDENDIINNNENDIINNNENDNNNNENDIINNDENDIINNDENDGSDNQDTIIPIDNPQECFRVLNEVYQIDFPNESNIMITHANYANRLESDEFSTKPFFMPLYDIPLVCIFCLLLYYTV